MIETLADTLMEQDACKLCDRLGALQAMNLSTPYLTRSLQVEAKTLGVSLVDVEGELSDILLHVKANTLGETLGYV